MVRRTTLSHRTKRNLRGGEKKDNKNNKNKKKDKKEEETLRELKEDVNLALGKLQEERRARAEEKNKLLEEKARNDQMKVRDTILRKEKEFKEKMDVRTDRVKELEEQLKKLLIRQRDSLMDQRATLKRDNERAKERLEKLKKMKNDIQKGKGKLQSDEQEDKCVEIFLKIQEKETEKGEYSNQWKEICEKVGPERAREEMAGKLGQQGGGSSAEEEAILDILRSNTNVGTVIAESEELAEMKKAHEETKKELAEKEEEKAEMEAAQAGELAEMKAKLEKAKETIDSRRGDAAAAATAAEKALAAEKDAHAETKEKHEKEKDNLSIEVMKGANSYEVKSRIENSDQFMEELKEVVIPYKQISNSFEVTHEDISGPVSGVIKGDSITVTENSLKAVVQYQVKNGQSIRIIVKIQESEVYSGNSELLSEKKKLEEMVRKKIHTNAILNNELRELKELQVKSEQVKKDAAEANSKAKQQIAELTKGMQNAKNARIEAQRNLEDAQKNLEMKKKEFRERLELNQMGANEAATAWNKWADKVTARVKEEEARKVAKAQADAKAATARASANEAAAVEKLRKSEEKARELRRQVEALKAEATLAEAGTVAAEDVGMVAAEDAGAALKLQESEKKARELRGQVEALEAKVSQTKEEAALLVVEEKRKAEDEFKARMEEAVKMSEAAALEAEEIAKAKAEEEAAEEFKKSVGGEESANAAVEKLMVWVNKRDGFSKDDDKEVGEILDKFASATHKDVVAAHKKLTAYRKSERERKKREFFASKRAKEKEADKKQVQEVEPTPDPEEKINLQDIIRSQDTKEIEKAFGERKLINTGRLYDHSEIEKAINVIDTIDHDEATDAGKAIIEARANLLLRMDSLVVNDLKSGLKTENIDKITRLINLGNRIKEFPMSRQERVLMDNGSVADERDELIEKLEARKEELVKVKRMLAGAKRATDDQQIADAVATARKLGVYEKECRELEGKGEKQGVKDARKLIQRVVAEEEEGELDEALAACEEFPQLQGEDEYRALLQMKMRRDGPTATPLPKKKVAIGRKREPGGPPKKMIPARFVKKKTGPSGVGYSGGGRTLKRKRRKQKKTQKKRN